MKTLLDIYRNYDKSLLESFTRRTKATDSKGLVSKSDRMVIDKKEYLKNLILSHSNFYDKRTTSRGINFGHTFEMPVPLSKNRKIEITVISYCPTFMEHEIVFYSSPFSRPMSFYNIVKTQDENETNEILDLIYDFIIEKIEMKIKLDSMKSNMSESFTRKTRNTNNDQLSDKGDDTIDEFKIRKLIEELCPLIAKFGKKSTRKSFYFKFNAKSPNTLKRLPTFNKFPYFDDFNATQVWLNTDFKNPDDRLQFNILNHRIYVSVPELIEMFGIEQVIRLLEETISIIKEMKKIRMDFERLGKEDFLQKYFK